MSTQQVQLHLSPSKCDRVPVTVWDHAADHWDHVVQAEKVDGEEDDKDSTATLENDWLADVEWPDGEPCSQHSQHWLDSSTCTALPPVLADANDKIVGVDGISLWLEHFGLAQYVQAFRDADICGEVLSMLSAEDCVKLGMTDEDADVFMEASQQRKVMWNDATRVHCYSPVQNSNCGKRTPAPGTPPRKSAKHSDTRQVEPRSPV